MTGGRKPIHESECRQAIAKIGKDRKDAGTRKRNPYKVDACRYDGIWKICLKVHTIAQKTHARTQALDRKYKHLDYMMASTTIITIIIITP